MTAKKEGKPIGLQTIHIIDDDKTAIAKSPRVHQEHRRLGISGLLTHD